MPLDLLQAENEEAGEEDGDALDDDGSLAFTSLVTNLGCWPLVDKPSLLSLARSDASDCLPKVAAMAAGPVKAEVPTPTAATGRPRARARARARAGARQRQRGLDRQPSEAALGRLPKRS